MSVKRALREAVLAQLRAKLEVLKKAMNDAQADANRYKGAMESRYDTFKEEAQALRDGFALQIQRTAEVLAQMEQVELRRCDTVAAGAAVITSQGNFFLSTGLVDLVTDTDGREYDCVGAAAPVAQALRGKKTGDVVELGGRELVILDVF